MKEKTRIAEKQLQQCKTSSKLVNTADELNVPLEVVKRSKKTMKKSDPDRAVGPLMDKMFNYNTTGEKDGLENSLRKFSLQILQVADEI